MLRESCDRVKRAAWWVPDAAVGPGQTTRAAQPDARHALLGAQGAHVPDEEGVTVAVSPTATPTNTAGRSPSAGSVNCGKATLAFCQWFTTVGVPATSTTAETRDPYALEPRRPLRLNQASAWAPRVVLGSAVISERGRPRLLACVQDVCRARVVTVGCFTDGTPPPMVS